MQFQNLIAWILFLIISLGCKSMHLTPESNSPTVTTDNRTSAMQKMQGQVNQCEVVQKKVWNTKTNQCQTQQEYCQSLGDGSIWKNNICLSLQDQCTANGGQWVSASCKQPQELCEEQEGHSWVNEQCLTSQENCVQQPNGYRYKWQGVNDTTGTCTLQTFLDFCKAGTQAPQAIQFTVTLVLRQAKTNNCSVADAWMRNYGTSLTLTDSTGNIVLSDISPIALYPIQTLILTNNKVQDFTPFANLKSLRVLDLQNNSITSLRGLGVLTQLQKLYLGYNQISDLTELGSLTSLQELDLFHNQLVQVNPLSSLANLLTLYLKDNAIESIAPLAPLVKLQTLDLSNTPLTSPNIVKTPQNCPSGSGVAQAVASLCQSLIANQSGGAN